MSVGEELFLGEYTIFSCVFYFLTVMAGEGPLAFGRGENRTGRMGGYSGCVEVNRERERHVRGQGVFSSGRLAFIRFC